MDLFQEAADKMVVYHLRTSWLALSKLFTEIASQYEGTLSHAFVLLAIYEEDGVHVTKIAPRIGMGPNSLTRTLNFLENKDIVIRIPDKEDNRKVLVYLTPYGKKLRKLALKSVYNLEKHITKDLSQEEINAFFNVVNKVPVGLDLLKKNIKP
jgi:DNA-binding MarR family transcriptional regulator